jgi:hypothetical protein
VRTTVSKLGNIDYQDLISNHTEYTPSLGANGHSFVQELQRVNGVGMFITVSIRSFYETISSIKQI